MKDSKRNRRNQEAKAQKRAEYYKPRRPVETAPLEATTDDRYGLDRAAQHFEDEANG